MFKQFVLFSQSRHPKGIIPATFCLLLFSLLCFSTHSSNLPEARLKVATCQFPVTGDVHKNARYIKDFIKEAALQKADIVHFSEASLTGYPPKDLSSFDNYDWDALSKETKEIMAVAKQFNVWVILGSAHYIDSGVKPTNCLYIISGKGEIVDRYDKSMLTDGDDGDVSFYSPGNHTTIININGFECGFLICYDSCFPEMYNIYRHKGVKIVFHSFYNAHYAGRTILDDIIPSEIRVRASDNLMWIIANNSSGDYSSWPSCIARPDGSLETLQRGIPGILYRNFPDNQIINDFPSWTHNNKIMALAEKEVYHNGIPSKHPRALDTKSLPYQPPR
ncbi:MAG: carbon-nitrogen hydrolase family protein [Ferruginibacter sp.]